MKKIYFLLVLITGITQSSFASVTPGDSVLLKTNASVFNNQRHSGIFNIPKSDGDKLTFGERLKLKIATSKYFKALGADKGEPTEKQKKQGKTAMILGIASIPLLFIPYVGLLAIPAAILAIVLGAKSVKGNSNARGIVGIVTGAVSLFLLVLAILYVAAFFGG